MGFRQICGLAGLMGVVSLALVLDIWFRASKWHLRWRKWIWIVPVFLATMPQILQFGFRIADQLTDEDAPLGKRIVLLFEIHEPVNRYSEYDRQNHPPRRKAGAK